MDLDSRVLAATKYIAKQLLVAFKVDFYDLERECYKTNAIKEFIKTVQTIRESTRADDDLAAAMAGTTI